MKRECNIVRDLLPLYIENMASEETREFVEAHLSKCPECNEFYTSMINNGDVNIADEEEQKKILPLRIVKQKLLCKKIVVAAIAVVLSLAILIGVGSAMYEYVDRQNKIVHIDYGESQWYSMKDRKEAADVILNSLYGMGFGYNIISIKYAGDPHSLQAYISLKEDMDESKENVRDMYNYMVFYVELETPAWANPFWGLKPSTHYDNLQWVMSRSDISGGWQGTYVTPAPAPGATPAE